MQDAELVLQREDKGLVSINDEGLQLWQGDITRLQVDAIVNAANAQALGCWLPLHNCIDNCIHSAAGIQLRKACADIIQGRLLKTGEAFITEGYNLPAKHVIHTVGPIIETGIPTKEQEEELAQCYRSCLDLAEQNHLESIAFCCISTGVFHFPNERAAEIAIETVRAYPRKSVQTVVFNVFLDKDYDIYKELL
jgi:O-acetyl-ADP-ribose deacetylase (regulator of RNase III)